MDYVKKRAVRLLARCTMWFAAYLQSRVNRHKGAYRQRRYSTLGALSSRRGLPMNGGQIFVSK
jgi:hypothetical protein